MKKSEGQSTNDTTPAESCQSNTRTNLQSKQQALNQKQAEAFYLTLLILNRTFRLAEFLLKHETLSLPDIVDILGPRPFPIKESVIEYLQELRARKSSSINEIISEEEKVAQEKRKEAFAATKFDPDAEDEKEVDTTVKKEGETASKADNHTEEKSSKEQDKDDKDKKQ